MRTGKTKATIDAACLLFEAGVIDTVVIACPAQVKPVWLAPEFGELKQHVFVSYRAIELETKIEDKLAGYLQACNKFHVLPFVVVSYEFLRQEDAQTDYHKVAKLVEALGHSKYWMICDEGCALGNWEAAQTRALYQLRQTASRVTILDGTPVGNLAAHPLHEVQIASDEARTQDEAAPRLPRVLALQAVHLDVRQLGAREVQEGHRVEEPRRDHPARRSVLLASRSEGRARHASDGSGDHSSLTE